MLERRWVWTVPVYVVVCVTLVVALRSAWLQDLPAQNVLASQPWPPRERRDAGGAAPLPLSSLSLLPSARRCQNDSTSWVGIISSAPYHFLHRRLIRRTWANHQQVVFLLGIANSTLQPLIEEETKQFGDIVQGNFIDSYRNLTYKHVMGLIWARNYCPGARYILKTDDDVFVNIPYFESFLPTLPEQQLIFCSLMKASLVQRSYRSKWRVTPEEYPGRWYPPYCAGWVILYSSDVASSIYSEAQKGPYFWIDDVHVTGTIVEKLNLTHTPLGKLGLEEEETEDMLSGESRSDFLFSLTGPKNFQRLWSIVTHSSNDI